ncbi:hypothetical protein ABVT39_026613 [Epinephelus coioides]
MLNSHRFTLQPSTEDIDIGLFVVCVLSEEFLTKDLTKQTVAKRSVKLLRGEEEEKKSKPQKLHLFMSLQEEPLLKRLQRWRWRCAGGFTGCSEYEVMQLLWFDFHQPLRLQLSYEHHFVL